MSTSNAISSVHQRSRLPLSSLAIRTWRRRVPVMSLALLLLCPAVAWAQNPPVFKFAWGSFGTAAGQFVFPTGLAVDADGNVYTTERAGTPPLFGLPPRPGTPRVQKFDKDGNFITEWRSGTTAAGVFWPADVVVNAATGAVYVADFFFVPVSRFRALKFDSNGVFILDPAAQGPIYAPLVSALNVLP